MRFIRVMASVVGLFVIGGAAPSIHAEDGDQGVTIFTPRLSGDHFVCSAVNVSKRTLRIGSTVLGVDGQPLNALPGSDANPTLKVNVQPKSEAELIQGLTRASPRRTGIVRLMCLGRMSVMTSG
jgi:hypothetical protein